MQNKKINQLDVKVAVSTDLMLVGDPATGISFKSTLATLPLVPYTGATANVALGEYGLTAGQLTLDTTPTGTAVVGTTRWNDTIGSSETTLKGGNVILKNGVDLVARVVNKVSPNTTLTKAAYQAVRVSGAQGQRLAVALAQANNDTNSADTIGLVTETIATNQEGFIMTVGNLEGINTTGSLQGETWIDGDVLYLSPTTAGRITNIKPTGAGHIVVVGYVEYSHSINGKIYVKVMNGWELDELHDVDIVNPLNNEALIYESSTSLWKNKTIATALGYTPVPTTRTLTINGTAYDLSADRSWTVSSAANTIYTADGTLTGNRSLTHGGFNLSFIGSTHTNRLTAAGRLLLGTTTESTYLLDVNGTARVSGNVVINAGTNTSITFGNNVYFDGPTIGTGNVYFRVANVELPATIATSINAGTGTIASNNTSFTIGYTGVTSLAIRQNTSAATWRFEMHRNTTNGSLEFSNDLSNPTLTLFPSRSIALGSYTETTSAKFAITSTTKGFLPPQMTTTQKNAIGTPAAGLVVYDTTTNKLCCYNGTTWNDLF